MDITMRYTLLYHGHFSFKDTCKNGDIRLTNGLDSSSGRVEICQYGRWGAMCTNKWDRDDARVVCYQLGYNNEGFPYTY